MLSTAVYMREIACSGVLTSGARVSSGAHAVESREWWGVVVCEERDCTCRCER